MAATVTQAALALAEAVQHHLDLTRETFVRGVHADGELNARRLMVDAKNALRTALASETVMCCRCFKRVDRLIGGSGACGPCIDDEDERRDEERRRPR